MKYAAVEDGMVFGVSPISEDAAASDAAHETGLAPERFDTGEMTVGLSAQVARGECACTLLSDGRFGTPEEGDTEEARRDEERSARERAAAAVDQIAQKIKESPAYVARQALEAEIFNLECRLRNARQALGTAAPYPLGATSLPGLATLAARLRSGEEGVVKNGRVCGRHGRRYDEIAQDHVGMALVRDMGAREKGGV